LPWQKCYGIIKPTIRQYRLTALLDGINLSVMSLPRFAMTLRSSVLAALTIGVIAAVWLLDSRHREVEFRNTLTPGQHYAHALWLCHHRSGLAPSASDLKAAIHHLEVIPAQSPVHPQAADLLPRLRVWRDRPQDFPAEEVSRFRSCVAKVEADEQVEAQKSGNCSFRTRNGKCVVDICGNYLVQECAALVTRDRAFQLLSLKDPR
jgi:hypothetical protein